MSLPPVRPYIRPVFTGSQAPCAPILLAGLTCAYFLLHAAMISAGYALRPEPFAPSAFWPPSGLLVATLYLTRKTVWPFIIFAAVAAGLITGYIYAGEFYEEFRLTQALYFTGLVQCEALVVASLCQRWLQPVNIQVRGVIRWMLASAIGVSISATLAAWALVQETPSETFLTFFQLWFGADFVGIMVAAPVSVTLLSLLRESSHRTVFASWPETIAFTAATLAVCGFVFGTNSNNVPHVLQLPYILIPVLIAAAIRLHSSIVYILLLCVAVIAVLLTNAGLGHFANQDFSTFSTVFPLQLYLATLAGTVVLIANYVGDLSRLHGALADSERNYRLYIDKSHEGIQHIQMTTPMPVNGISITEQVEWIMSKARVVDCNRAYVKGLQLESKDEALGDFVNDTSFPDTPENRFLIERYIANGFRLQELEYSLDLRDGSRAHFLQNLIGIVEDGHLTSSWANIANITQRKLAERKLETQEQQFRNLVEGSLQGITIDQSGVLVFANQSFAEMLEFDSADQLINSKSAIRYVAPHERRRAVNFAAKVMEGNSAPTLTTFDAITRKGSPRILEMLVQKVEWQGDDALQCIYVDVTDKIDAQRALQLANDELEIKVDARTKELAEANEQLQELDKLKSLFIASMSHELRTPLNAIIGFSGILLKQMTGPLNENQLDQIQRISESGKHLLALLSEIIDISKIEADRIDVYPESLMVADLVQACVDIARQSHRKDQITLTLAVADDIVAVTDKKALSKCLINLLTNAYKYTESGTISLSVEELGDSLVFTITDTGIGISESDQRKLFAPFERFESHLKIRAGGTGLGLYVVKKVAEDILGGGIEVESELGEGSCFRLAIAKTIPEQGNE